MTSAPIRNIHERHIELPIEDARELLATLASAEDRLWPSDHWPAMILDDGLNLGSRGGHGDVRYHVSARTPDLVEFTFDPSFGLTGTHTFELVRDGSGTLARHELRGEAAGSMRLGWVLVVEPLHDAVIEGVFDRLDRAGGKQVRTPWTGRVKVLRKAFAWAGTGPQSGAQKAIGWGTATTLFGVAALHVVWATGHPWPLATRKEFAETILSRGEDLPPAAASLLVAGGLGAAAAAAARPTSSPRRALALATAGALLLRSSSLVLAPVLPKAHPKFARADRRLYAPLCLALGAGILAALRPRR